MYFFWLCLTIAQCYHFVDYVTLFCHNALLLSLYFATCPTLLLHLIVAPPCYYYELHLATAMSSSLLLLQAPPCHCYSTIVAAMPGFLPYCVAAQPCCFSTFAISLLVSSTNGVT